MFINKKKIDLNLYLEPKGIKDYKTYIYKNERYD